MSDAVASDEWTFFARIHPESVPISKPRSEVDATFDSLGVAYHLTLDIAQSQVIAAIRLSKVPPDISTLRNCVEASIRSEMDLIGYLFGGSFDVEMLGARNTQTGASVVFGITIPALSDKREYSGALTIPGELLVAVGASVQTQAALAYFREAVRIPVDTGFFCYRAIEALLRAVVDVQGDVSGANWAAFRSTLRIARDAVMFVKSHSDLPRHGAVSSISDEQRAKVLRITDETIRRHLHWLTHDRSPLSDEFPVLLSDDT